MVTKLLTLEEAAAVLHITRRTAYQWAWTRKIRSVKIGRSVMIPEDAIAEFIDAHTIPASAQ